MNEDPHSNTQANTHNPNPNNRTEQEYRALIRGWIKKLEGFDWTIESYLFPSIVGRVIKEMKKEVP